jgi:hypothetical protein
MGRGLRANKIEVLRRGRVVVEADALRGVFFAAMRDLCSSFFLRDCNKTCPRRMALVGLFPMG